MPVAVAPTTRITTEYITTAVAAREGILPPRGQLLEVIDKLTERAPASKYRLITDLYLGSESRFKDTQLALLDAIDRCFGATATGNRLPDPKEDLRNHNLNLSYLGSSPTVPPLITSFINECRDWETLCKIWWPRLKAALWEGDLPADQIEYINSRLLLWGFWISNTRWRDFQEKLEVENDPLVTEAANTLRIINRYFEVNRERTRVIVAPNLSLGLMYPPFAYLSDSFRKRMGIVIPDRQFLATPASHLDQIGEGRIIVIYTYYDRDFRCTEGGSALLRVSEALGNLDVISVDHSIDQLSSGQKFLKKEICWAEGFEEGVLVEPSAQSRRHAYFFNANRKAGQGGKKSSMDDKYILWHETIGVPILLDGGRRIENSARAFMSAFAEQVEKTYEKAA